MNERKIRILSIGCEVLSGKLSIEKALEQVEVEDKRTMVHWVKVVKDFEQIEVKTNIMALH